MSLVVDLFFEVVELVVLLKCVLFFFYKGNDSLVIVRYFLLYFFFEFECLLWENVGVNIFF